MEDQTSKVVTDRLASTSIKKPSSTRLSTRPLNLTETDQDVVARGTQNSPLPPSVETAYYRKCIELKRRINEIEESNDAARLRKVRINRQILKMRLERAFLLEQLQKRMENNVDDSDRSSSPPPTVRPEVLTVNEYVSFCNFRFYADNTLANSRTTNRCAPNAPTASAHHPLPSPVPQAQ